MRIMLIAAFFVLLAISSPVSAVVPDLRMSNIFNQEFDQETSCTSSQYEVLKSKLPPAECSRIGLVSGDVAEYRIRINVGPGEYDYITLTNYVKEKKPWKINTGKNLVILPGQGLTEKFYSDMAIYYAQRKYSVYIVDRRETNIPSNEEDFSFMEYWTVEEHLNDTYKAINASRSHTSFLSKKPAENIEVTAIGHSHGALILTAYEASQYDDMPLGTVDRIVPVDIIIKYDPQYPELIYNQTQEFNIISSDIENEVYEGTGMASMIYVASMAYSNPEGSSPYPGLTNIQLFRLMASQTYILSSYPYTPDYHYWSGDLSGLSYVNESRLLYLTLSGGAAPFTPKYMDQYMAGLMGNVDGYEINSSSVDSPVLYVGLGGGFGDYGSWWYENEVGNTNSRVTSMIWNNQGHASLLIDQNSPELWALIDNWIKNTET